MAHDDVYKVFAIRYGRSDQRSPSNYIGGDSHDVAEPLDYYVWAVVNDQRTVIIDTGFDEKRGESRNRTIIRSVEEGLVS
ncbi:hypothetical protein [Bradyrhizobium sp. NAS80.1]|uniref:hypothetical protein n=1 Tax=Bradyrhizobium sp. NAS80.1 TaxID=1680159 RepID=UPI0011614200|nr:hypothetical protein [Bradyrhizobium sp. NAS80.1]